ncbi:hypothetical protein BAN_0900038 (plasmid) [Borrelia anserina BA2]|uniref:Uncharacterized protein n=2 Tax=Borrelia anserina TaxID=143 RepID=W5SQ62_BORAN|nr:hypothetical protein BAN_0900038 [Borrelia anserina BA2]
MKQKIRETKQNAKNKQQTSKLKKEINKRNTKKARLIIENKKIQRNKKNKRIKRQQEK